MNILYLNIYIKQFILFLLNIFSNYLNKTKYLIINDIPIYKYNKIIKIFDRNFANILLIIYYLIWRFFIYLLYVTINSLYKIYNNKNISKISLFYNIIIKLINLIILIFILSLLYSY